MTLNELNLARQISAGVNYLSPTDYVINVNTSAGAVVIYLPSIPSLLAFRNQSGGNYSQALSIVDISNNASINNITILTQSGNILNGLGSFVINTDGGSCNLSVSGDNTWLLESSQGVPTSPAQTGLITFDITANVPNYIYDFTYGNYCKIKVDGTFKNVILPTYTQNLFELYLNSPVVSDVVSIDVNQLTELVNLHLGFSQGKLTLANDILELPNLYSLDVLSGINNPTFTIQNCPLLYSVGNIASDSIIFNIINNPSLFIITLVQPYNGIQNLVIDNNASLDIIEILICPSLSSISITNCPVITSFQGTNIGADNTTITNFNVLTGINTISKFTWDNAPLTTDVDITGMTALNDIYIRNCALTALTIENLLVNLDTNGLLNGFLDITGGTNATYGTWTPAAINAYNNLIAKTWSILYNP